MRTTAYSPCTFSQGPCDGIPPTGDDRPTQADPYTPDFPANPVIVDIRSFPVPIPIDYTPALQAANAQLDLIAGVGNQGFVLIPPGPPGQYILRSRFVPRSNTTYYGGGTLVRGPDINDGDMIEFGGSGSNDGPHFNDIVFGGLTVDANGFRSSGALFEWNSKRDVSNITLTNLTFIDSQNAPHPNDMAGVDTADDWSINLGGWCKMTDFTIKNCVHNSPTHQFVASGFKHNSEITRLSILDNTLHGSRSVSISITGWRESGVPEFDEENFPGQCVPDVSHLEFPFAPPKLRDVVISGNVIINPWRSVISVGIDGVDFFPSCDPANVDNDPDNDIPYPRAVDIDGLTISNNFIMWDEEGNDHSSNQNTRGIRCRFGEQETSSVKNVLVCNNAVINDGHTAKLIGGISVTLGTLGGIQSPAPQMTIIDNFFPNNEPDILTIALGGEIPINHSDIHVENNTVGENDPANPTQPCDLSLGAYEFDHVNDVPNMSPTVSLETSSLDISFRMYVPHFPDPGTGTGDRFYIFYYDSQNYLRLHDNGKLVLRLGDNGNNHQENIVSPGRLKENTTHTIQITGFPDGTIMATYDGKPGTNGPVDFSDATATVFPIDNIGAKIVKNAVLNPIDIFTGHLWDMRLADANSEVILTGTFQDENFEPWEDQLGIRNGILTPLQPYVFDGINDIPVPTMPIFKSFDNLDIEFGLYVTDMSSDSYLFFSHGSEFIRLNSDGRIILKDTTSNVTVQKTLVSPGRIQEHRSYRIRFKDTDETDGVLLRAFINGSTDVPGIGSVGPSVSNFGNDSELEIKEIGGRIASSSPKPIKGAIWDIKIFDNGGDLYDESYEGAFRSEEKGIWKDLLGNNSSTDNPAILTPFQPFVFDQTSIVELSPNLEIDYDQIDISFKIRVDVLDEASPNYKPYIFYHNSGNYLQLRHDGAIRLKLNNSSFYNIFQDDFIEQGGTYDVRIFSEVCVVSGVPGLAIRASVNGREGPCRQLSSPMPFPISYIGGRPQGDDLFHGAIWDLSINENVGPIASYSGDFGNEPDGPWDDTSGNGHDGIVIEF